MQYTQDASDIYAWKYALSEVDDQQERKAEATEKKRFDMNEIKYIFKRYKVFAVLFVSNILPHC